MGSKTHPLIYPLYGVFWIGRRLSPPKLLDKSQVTLPAGTQWRGDYYTVTDVGKGKHRTIMIGEPPYHYCNHSAFIEGAEKVVMFDLGTGLGDIWKIVTEMTRKPVIIVHSHQHYDHLGAGKNGRRLAQQKRRFANLPFVREKAAGNVLVPTWQQHVGGPEGFKAPQLIVEEWLDIGSEIDLGNRVLKVLYAPGHSDDHIVLFDMTNNFLFAGDLIGTEPIFTFLPTSSLGDLLWSVNNLLQLVDDETKIFGTHPRKGYFGPPIQGIKDLVDLHELLVAMRDGRVKPSGFFPRRYSGDLVQIEANFRLRGDWERRHPETPFGA